MSRARTLLHTCIHRALHAKVPYIVGGRAYYGAGRLVWIKDVDLLYHESTFLDDSEQRAAETYHSTAKQAATIAKKANAKKLLLGHFSAKYDDLSSFAIEAKTIFPNAEIAEEGKYFEVKR